MRRVAFAIFYLGCFVVGGFIGVALTATVLPDPTPAPLVLQDHPGVAMEVLDPSLTPFVEMWRKEIARRFPDGAVGLLVHGGDLVQKEWVVGASIVPGHVTPIEEVIDRTRRLYGQRKIIVLACNPGHVRLSGRPGVYFFPGSVWCIPDRAILPEHSQYEVLRRLGEPAPFLGEQPEPTPIVIVNAARELTRWESDDTVCGNIWEAVEAR
jgi:hypothetical protein